MPVLPSFKVLLINPSSNRFYVPTASLGLSLLAAALPDDVATQGLDLNVLKWIFGLNQDSLLATVENYLQKSRRIGVQPDLIGISVYQETLPEATAIGKLARKYGVKSVVGGIYPTMFPGAIPRAFDFMVRGAGERPLVDLVSALGHEKYCSCHEDHPLINGVSYPLSDTEWVHIGIPAAVSAKESSIPKRDIFTEFNMGFQYYSARVLSSRGCPHACSFCINSEFARKEWLPRPEEAIVKEIEVVLRDSAISEISFSDDQFLGFTREDFVRAYRILRFVEELTRDRNIRINLQVRSDQFLKALDTVPELAGVIRAINHNFIDYSADISVRIHGRPVRGFSLDIGVESFLDERLAGFTKGLTARENVAAVRRARELEVDLGLYMLLFSPEVTLDQIEQEIEIYLQEFIDTDNFSKAALLNLFQEVIPYRGTAIYRQLKNSGELVESANYLGFKFRDPKVAAFYLYYLYNLRFGMFDPLNNRSEWMNRIRELLQWSRETVSDPMLRPVLSEVVCELEDLNQLRGLYNRLSKERA